MLKSPTVKATATDSPVSRSTPVLIAVSPSGPRPPNAPAARSANPAGASRPESAMAAKLSTSEASRASTAPQSGSRFGAKIRARSSGKRGLLPEHHPAELLVAGVGRGLAGDE